MKEIENIVTELPYKESPLYVEQLLSRCQANAKRSSRPMGAIITRPWFYGIAATAAALILGVFLFVHNSSPMDRFLASLTDDEAAMILDWPVDDIPECYY
jgi:hypothetical protein